MGLQNFLMEFYQVYEKNISPTWEKLKNFESWPSTSLGLHILPNTELRQGNWKLVSYRKIKCLGSNLVCVNVVSLSVGKQNDIAYEISEKVS